MKKGCLIFCVLLFLQKTVGQDYRVLQADKSKVFVSTTSYSDSLVKVAIINADWRLDYVQRTAPSHADIPACATAHDSTASRSKHKMGRVMAAAEYHHVTEPLTHSFYISIPGTASINGIFDIINREYSIVDQSGGGFPLIRHFLPDTAAEYYVDGYKGNNSASLEVMYLWGAPLRDWTLGFSLSIRDREARKVLSTITCMGPDETEFEVRKIRIRQSSLLSIMSYKDMFCPESGL